jgi:hypothetical protein
MKIQGKTLPLFSSFVLLNGAFIITPYSLKLLCKGPLFLRALSWIFPELYKQNTQLNMF